MNYWTTHVLSFPVPSPLLQLTLVLDVDFVEPLILPAPGVGVDYLSGKRPVASKRSRG